MTDRDKHSNKKKLEFSFRHQQDVVIVGETGVTWRGVVTGMIDEPALMLTTIDGARVMLPQRFRAIIPGGES